MSEAVKKDRPEFRNIHFVKDLPNYRMPLASIVSFAHRVSGALLVLLLPLILFLLDKSLTSEISFEYLKGFVSGWFVKLMVLVLAWGYLQHFCSGIRHLIMDTHIGLDKDSARKSSAAVLGVSLFLTAVVALKLFGAF
jgi:succinate dehydrogenase / fumarate reductase, cytochrome b subunit